MPTKHGKMVTYFEELNSHYSLNILSRLVMWQIKNKSPLPKWLWSPDLPGNIPWRAPSQNIEWTLNEVVLRGHVTDWYIISPLSQCLWLSNFSGQYPVITWHEPLITFTTWSHVTVWKIYSSSFIRFMATKLEVEVQPQMLKLSPNSYLVVIFLKRN